MSAFREAARQWLEADLVCPACQEENIRGKPSKIKLDDPIASERASCDNCGFGGPLKAFQRREGER